MFDFAQPTLLIDCSYFVFYRYYAIKGWYTRANEQDVDVGSIMQNRHFLDKYDKTFEKTLDDLVRTYGNKGSINMVFARDCSRENIWRTSIYPAYKASRDDRSSSFNGEIFKHTYNTLFPVLKNKFNFIEVQHNKLEADDMVALFIKRTRDNFSNYDKDITVITNDNDYVQLYKYGVDIVNLQNKHLKHRIEDVTTYLEYKIIAGDKSDNIRAIAKKVGDKTTKKMMVNPEYFEKVMSSIGAQEQYLLNKTLVDFECIPQPLQDDAFCIIDKILKV